MSKNGYILLHRSIMTHYAFEDEPKTAREAFIWLLMNASYSPHKTLYKGKIIAVNRGQIPTSYRRLMAEFQWSLGRIQRYITRLSDEGMIDTATDTGFLVITICNYDKYQVLSTGADTPTDTQTDTVTDTQTDTSIIKGEKKRKEKKDKEELKENSSLSSGVKKKFVFPERFLPETKAAWDGYLEVRKGMRAPNTVAANDALIEQLDALVAKGYDPTAIIKASMRSGWRDFFEPKGGGATAQAETAEVSEAEQARIDSWLLRKMNVLDGDTEKRTARLAAYEAKNGYVEPTRKGAVQ